MALQNDPRLYSGGSQVVDMRPHTMLYAQLKAREQAKNEAFDDYIRNLNKNVNSAGMRNQEREVFEDKLRQWQDYGLKNRESLRNPRKDNGAASMQFQAGYQDLQNLIAESKTREEGKKPIIPLMLDPDKRDRMDDGFMEEISYHDAPLYVRGEDGQWTRNPQSRTLDLGRLSFEPKPFDQGKFSQSLDDIKASQSSQVVNKLPNLKEEIVTTSIFSPEDKEVVAYRAIGQYGQDKSFKKFIKDLAPEERQALAQLYEAEFKQPATDDAHLAAAYGLKIKQEGSTTKKVNDDNYAQSVSLEGIKNANRKALLKMRDKMKKDDVKANNLWVESYITRAITESQKPQNRTEYKFRDGTQVKGYKIPLDPVLRKAVGLDIDKANGMLIVTDNGDFIIAPYKTDGTYKPIKGSNGQYTIDSEKASRISSDQLKLALSKSAAGVTQTNKEMMEVEDDDLGILD